MGNAGKNRRARISKPRSKYLALLELLIARGGTSRARRAARKTQERMRSWQVRQPKRSSFILRSEMGEVLHIITGGSTFGTIRSHDRKSVVTRQTLAQSGRALRRLIRRLRARREGHAFDVPVKPGEARQWRIR
jgi:hypothetical protein